MKKEEDKYVTFLKERFERNGFITYTEVVPDECKTWEHPWRVDLIVFKKEHGWIAIEAKHIKTLGQGSIIAQALEQVKKYRPLHYQGNIINRWVIAPKFYSSDNYYEKESILCSNFIQHFLKYYDVSFLNFNGVKIYIDIGSKDSIIIK